MCRHQADPGSLRRPGGSNLRTPDTETVCSHRQWRCWQTNSNQSPPGQSHCPLFGAETAPFGESGGAVLLEEASTAEAALLVEVIEERGVDGGEFPKTSHASKS